MDDNGVSSYLLELEYVKDSISVVVDNREVRTMQRQATKIRLGGGLVISGLNAIAVAVSATVNWLANTFSIWVTPVAPGSIILEASVPKNATEMLKKLLRNGSIKRKLQKIFEDIEGYLAEEVGSHFKEKIDDQEWEELKKIRVADVKLCSVDDAKKILNDLEESETPEKGGALQRLPPPSNLRVKPSPYSPSTSLLAVYEVPKQTTFSPEDVSFLITVQRLSKPNNKTEEEKNLEKFSLIRTYQTSENWAVLDGLAPGGVYMVMVQCKDKGGLGEKARLSNPVETPFHDPLPWKREKLSAIPGVEGSGIETVSKIYETDRDAKSGDPFLWNSDLHKELRKILRKNRFPNERMKKLLSKCEKLGLVEVGDLKFLEDKEFAEKLAAEETLRIVEKMLLMEYAADQYGTSTTADHGLVERRVNRHQTDWSY